jgi:hypothetical protein
MTPKKSRAQRDRSRQSWRRFSSTPLRPADLKHGRVRGGPDAALRAPQGNGLPHQLDCSRPIQEHAVARTRNAPRSRALLPWFGHKHLRCDAIFPALRGKQCCATMWPPYLITWASGSLGSARSLSLVHARDSFHVK